MIIITTIDLYNMHNIDIDVQQSVICTKCAEGVNSYGGSINYDAINIM